MLYRTWRYYRVKIPRPLMSTVILRTFPIDKCMLSKVVPAQWNDKKIIAIFHTFSLPWVYWVKYGPLMLKLWPRLGQANVLIIYSVDGKQTGLTSFCWRHEALLDLSCLLNQPNQILQLATISRFVHFSIFKKMLTWNF
jgi:hypothetical protein